MIRGEKLWDFAPPQEDRKENKYSAFHFFLGYYTCITHASTRPCDPTSSLQLRAAPEPLESGESGWKVVQPEDFPKIWSDWNQIDIDHWSDFYWIVRSCFHGNSMDDSALTPSNMQDPRQWCPGQRGKVVPYQADTHLANHCGAEQTSEFSPTWCQNHHSNPGISMKVLKWSGVSDINWFSNPL